MLKNFIAATLCLFSATALADALDINLNDKAAQLSYHKAAGMNFQGNAEWHVGALYNDQRNNFFDAGLLVKGEEEAIPGLGLGIGAKGIFANLNDTKNSTGIASAIALGLELSYALPTVRRVALTADLFGSLKIVTFNDANRFTQSRIRIEYEVVPRTFAYIGYRYLHAELKTGGDSAIDDGAVLGVRMGF